MEQHLSLMTLGVRDVAEARGFYERLGWKASNVSDADVVFFQIGGLAFGLYGRETLAAEEVAWNPGFPLREDATLSLPE